MLFALNSFRENDELLARLWEKYWISNNIYILCIDDFKSHWILFEFEREREREKEKNSYSFVEMCEEKILKREVNYKFLFCFSFFSCIFSFGVFFPFFPSFSICFVFIPFFFFVLNTHFCIVPTVNCLSEFFHPRYLFTFTFLHFFFFIYNTNL